MEILDKKYTQLLQDLKSIQEAAKDKAEKAFHLILAESYWLMGQRLAEEPFTEAQKQTTFKMLAEDLGLERSLLFRVLKFFFLWPAECPVRHYPELTWSHYKLLLSIEKDEARKFYLTGTQDNKWQVRLLSQKIKDNAYLTSLKVPEGANSGGTPTLTRRTEALHIYKTGVNYVIDGDTLVINIDLGFDVWVKKRLRLRGINTPEMKSDDPAVSKKAQEAKAFVEARIPSGTVIVIQTFQVDLHGRFVADVFYKKEEADKERIFAEGKFLNQELLDAGLAEMI